MDEAGRPAPGPEEIQPEGEPLPSLPYAGADIAPVGEGSRALDDGAEAAAAPPLAIPTTAPDGAEEPAEREGGALLMGSPTARLTMPPIQGGSRGALDDAPLRRIGPPRPTPLDPEARPRDLEDATVPRPPAPRAQPKEISVTEEQAISVKVTREDLERLSGDISSLYIRVATELAGNRAAANQALASLSEARTILLGRPGFFPRAELLVEETRFLMQRVAFSQAAAKQHQGRLLNLNLIWLILFVAFFALDGVVTTTLLARGLAFRPAIIPDSFQPSLVWYFQPWLCVLMGGIGGALAAIVNLGRDVISREYDPAYNLDYRLNPIKGAIIGGLTYYILLGGFITVAATTTLATQLPDFVQRVQVANSPLFLLVAFIAGFAQQRFFALLPQIWDGATRREEAPGPGLPVGGEEVPVEQEPVALPPTMPERNGSGAELPPLQEALPVDAPIGATEYDPFGATANELDDRPPPAA